MLRSKLMYKFLNISKDIPIKDMYEFQWFMTVPRDFLTSLSVFWDLVEYTVLRVANIYLRFHNFHKGIWFFIKAFDSYTE